MKKFIAVLLAAVLCLGLTACEKPKTDKSIDITMNNWSEYFEFSAPYSVYCKNEDSSDYIKEVQGASIDFYFTVKEKYIARLDTKRSNISVKISADIGTQMGIFSPDYSAFEPSGEFIGKPIIKEGNEFTKTPYSSFALHIAIASANEQTIAEGKMSSFIKNPSVLNIAGTLYFVD